MTKNEAVTEIVKRNGIWEVVGKKTGIIYFSGTLFGCCSVGDEYDSEEKEVNEMKSNRISTNALADPS